MIGRELRWHFQFPNAGSISSALHFIILRQEQNWENYAQSTNKQRKVTFAYKIKTVPTFSMLINMLPLNTIATVSKGSGSTVMT
jgi:hypothetical protein